MIEDQGRGTQALLADCAERDRTIAAQGEELERLRAAVRAVMSPSALTLEQPLTKSFS